MAESNNVPQINPAEIEILIEKLEQNKLEERERRLIVALLRTFLYVVAQLQEKKITLLKIKEMIFGRKSEKNKREKEKSKEGEKETAEGGPEGSGDGEQSQEPKNEKQESDGAVCAPDKRGHGRNPVSAYPGAKKVRCKHRQLKSGQSCPGSRCEGRIYPVIRPHHFTQFTGQPTITVTIYEQEVLRCNDCGKEYEAPLPEGVSPKRYDETADAQIAISKCGLGTPYNRSAALQWDCGMPVSESVMAERCEAVADALFPIYQEMRRRAANGRRRHAGADTGIDQREQGERTWRTCRDANFRDRRENGGRRLHCAVYERTQARGRKHGRVV